MTTVTKLGPADHGRPLSYDEYLAGDYESGYKYELIDGRLYVSPLPNPFENWLENWLYRALDRYAARHAQVINYVTTKSRVVVPDRPGLTTPEPDIAAFRDFPEAVDGIGWEDVSPVLVVEVLVEGDPRKDLERNVELYLQVPTIREYWILDGREGLKRLSLTAYRRRGQRWQRPISVPFGETYTTQLLPGFSLRLRPRASR
jgi:Uma2 family endonuclease